MKVQVTLTVEPQPQLRDPEAEAVTVALADLGFDNVEAMHVGKIYRWTEETPSLALAEQRAEEMARRILANPVSEHFTVEVHPYLEGTG